MSEKTITLLNAEMPESVDKALTNLTEQPTKAVGNTIADIWFLVFGGIGHLAEKRKLRYAAELEKYSNELKEKVENIPGEKRVEADMQIVAPALEASKYCVEKEELRSMFVNLIASSMNSDKMNDVHPIFTDIICKLSPIDATLFKTLTNIGSTDSLLDINECIFWKISVNRISFSLAVLEQLGLITFGESKKENNDNWKMNEENIFLTLFYNNVQKYYSNVVFDTIYTSIIDKLMSLLTEKSTGDTIFPRNKSIIEFFSQNVSITKLGTKFKDICL